MSHKRVFVSGEAGLLAEHLIEELRHRGAVILNDHMPKTWLRSSRAEDPRHREVNLLSPDLELLFERTGQPTHIMHTAALVSTDKCAASELDAYEQNVRASYNLACLWRPGTHYTYFSTTAIYDPAPEVPRAYTVYSPVRPHTLYGQTKYLGELVTRSLVPSYSLLVVRPCFVYGGARNNQTSVVMRLIDATLNEGSSVQVLLDPTKKKDLMHVNDFVQTMIGLLNNHCSGVYNVGRGQAVKFQVVLDLLRSYGIKSELAVLSPELDYMGDHFVETARTVRDSGHCPSIELKQGLVMAIEEMKKGASCRTLTS